MNVRLYLLQRASALVLAPLVLAHLALIVYAVRGGLSAAEILGRTQGSLGWALFYTVFVLVVAVHGAIGLRQILAEWTALGATAAGRLALAAGAVLALLGLRAVIAVCWPGGEL